MGYYHRVCQFILLPVYPIYELVSQEWKVWVVVIRWKYAS